MIISPKCLWKLFHKILMFWKQCGQKGKCWKSGFTPFATMFCLLSKTFFGILATFKLSSANALNSDKLWFNPFPNKPWFLSVCSTSLLKTLWEKEKLLVTSSFSFSRSVFYPFGELSAIFIKFEIVVCKSFQFGRVQIGHLGKGW